MTMRKQTPLGKALRFEQLESRELLTVVPYISHNVSGVAGASTPDTHTLTLQEGDIVAVKASPSLGGNIIAMIFDGDETHLATGVHFSSNDFSLPPTSPIQATHDVNIFFTAPISGDYTVAFQGNGSDAQYSGVIEVFTTLLHDSSGEVRQTIFVDFDGVVDYLWGSGTYDLPAFSGLLEEFGDALGLFHSLDENEVIDAVMYHAEQFFAGYPIDFIDSRLGDLWDPVLYPYTSRVIVSDSSSIIPGHPGLAERIDVGNFVTTDTAHVNVAEYFSPSSGWSISSLTTQAGPLSNASTATIIEAIGRALGQCIAHEVGHLLGLYHTSDPSDVMYQIGSNGIEWATHVGVDGIFGTLDDEDARLAFTWSQFHSSVAPVGNQDSPSILRAALGDALGAPRITSLRLVDERPQTPNLGDISFDFAELDAISGEYLNVGSEIQLLTVPVLNVHRIEISFSEQVRDDSLLASALRVVNLASGELVEVESFIGYAPETRTATWEIAGLGLGPHNAGQYVVAINSEAVADRLGILLDGEWDNPASLDVSVSSSVFPSGDGNPGGDFAFVFTLLPGDATQRGPNGEITSSANKVDVLDLSKLSSNYNTSTPNGFSDGDFNNDGEVNALDLSILSSNYNVSLRAVLVDVNQDGILDLDDWNELTSEDINRDGVHNEDDEEALFSLIALDLGLRFTWGV